MNQPNDIAAKNRRVAGACFSVVACMVALSFAAVPLYELFCRVTGYGGTTQVSEEFSDTILERTMTIRFDSATHTDLPWAFGPAVREIDVKIGEPGIIAYRARNDGPRPTVGTAVYNVTPAKAGIYFHKVQCFCFDEQTLVPGQAIDFPVYFYVDPTIVDDPGMDDVTTITLSYTFFRAQSDALAEAAEIANETETVAN